MVGKKELGEGNWYYQFFFVKNVPYRPYRPYIPTSLHMYLPRNSQAYLWCLLPASGTVRLERRVEVGKTLTAREAAEARNEGAVVMEMLQGRSRRKWGVAGAHSGKFAPARGCGPAG